MRSLPGRTRETRVATEKDLCNARDTDLDPVFLAYVSTQSAQHPGATHDSESQPEQKLYIFMIVVSG